MTDEERKQFINEYCRNLGNIKIKCDYCKFVEDCVDYGWDGCRKFTPKLKRCPFCGSEAKIGRIFGHDTVYCSECDACILPSPYNSFANTEKELGKSIETWNKRVVAE